MGAFRGPTARTRLTLWACLNHKFSPAIIQDTKTEFVNWLGTEPEKDVQSAIMNGLFYDFAKYLGCVQETKLSDDPSYNSDRGWDLFEPGTMNILSMIVFYNLSGGLVFVNGESIKFEEKHPISPNKFKSSNKNGEYFYPRPMLFERIFRNSEKIIVRNTKYGINIILQSQASDQVEERHERRLKFGTEEGFIDPEA